MRLVIGTAMTYGQVHCDGRHMLNTLEVVHTVGIGDIALTTKDVDNRTVDLSQLLLGNAGHTRHTTGIGATLVALGLLKQSAVADHDRGNALVEAVEECLQTAARHTRDTDVLGVDLLIERTVLIGILLEGPVHRLHLLLRA